MRKSKLPAIPAVLGPRHKKKTPERPYAQLPRKKKGSRKIAG
jgi:hypothetical protein